jgi:hypothetical protein
MILKNQKISIKVHYTNIDHLKSKGYNCSLGDTLEIYAEDLKEKSNINVKCVCNQCKNEYEQRFSRNTEICYDCRKKEKRKTFKNVRNRKIKDSELYRNFFESLDFSKIEYKDVINSFLEKYSIQLNYANLKQILDELEIKHEKKEHKYFIGNIETYKKDCRKYSIQYVKQKYNLLHHQILLLCKKYKIKKPLNQWEIDSNKIEEKWNDIIELQKTKSIPEIINELDLPISDSKLRVIFNQKKIPINSHSYNKSKGEIEILNYVKSLGFEAYSRKFKTSDGIKELDIYIPDINLGIEYCGLYWHSHEVLKNKNYHKNKTKLFKNEYNINVITIFENEWKNKPDIIKSILHSKLGVSKRIYARKTECKIISSHDAKAFHEENHIHGYVNSSLNVGLFYNSELVGCMSFAKNRFAKNKNYEITRMSFKLNHTIVGGVSKMFKFSGLNDVTTFADLKFGEGKSYEKIGFDFIEETPPNYWYFNKNTMKLESRIQYQKHKLKDKLAIYDEELTEYENMINNNFYRIYDCGSNKFEYKKGQE